VWSIKGVDNSTLDVTVSDPTFRTNVGTILNGKAFTYTLTDSQITLKSINSWNSANGATPNTVYTAAANVQIEKNKNSYTFGGNTLLTDNSTKFVVYSGSPNTAVVYTGSANLPTTISGSTNLGYFVVKSNDATTATTNVATASVVFINRGAAAEALTSTNTSNYAYVDINKYVQTLVDGTTNYVYTATKADGSTIELTSTTSVGSNGIYTYSDSNVLNTTPLAYNTGNTNTQDSGRIVYDTNVTVSGSLVAIEVNGVTGYYSITNDTQIVYIDDNLGEVNNNGGFFVFEVSDGTPTENLASIFITVD
jgi:hypothetical protein